MISARASVWFIAALSISCAINFSFDVNSADAAEPAGSLSIASAAYGAVQNLGVRTIAVNRTGGSSGAATVLCKTFNDTAMAGAQYTAVSTTLQWANGDSAAKYCSVPISDAVPFQGVKTFYVAISDATGATLGSLLMATVTIYGNYGGGSVSLSAPTYTVAQSEGAATATITVNRTGGSKGDAAVYYSTADVTANAGADYTATKGTLTWANADASPRTISIPISKTPFVGAKTLAIAIASAENADLGSPASAIVTVNGINPGEATLSWNRPSTNTDGTPLTNLAGYKIYFGTSPSDMYRVFTVSNPATVELEISNLSSATWYFAVAAYNTDGTESVLSPIGSKTI